MLTKIIEVTNNDLNWGKFMLLRPDTEWQRKCLISDAPLARRTPLLQAVGTSGRHLWVLDLQTGEGINVDPAGFAPADLRKHQVWVCPMFEPFLMWLYAQDLTDLAKLPDTLNLPDAPFAFRGYRRKKQA